jgi:hypothetical protein
VAATPFQVPPGFDPPVLGLPYASYQLQLNKLQYIDSSTAPAPNSIADHVSIVFPGAAVDDVVGVYDLNDAENRWDQKVVGYISSFPVVLPTGATNAGEIFLHPRWRCLLWRFDVTGWRLADVVPFPFGSPGLQTRPASTNGVDPIPLVSGLELNFGTKDLVDPTFLMPPRPADALLGALPTAVIGDEENIMCGVSFNGFTGSGTVSVGPSSLRTVRPSTATNRNLTTVPGTGFLVDSLRGAQWRTARYFPPNPPNPELCWLLANTSSL